MFQRVNEFLLATGFLCAVCLMSVQAQEKSREIYVPFKDLKSILAGPIERIYLPRSEYESLLKKAVLQNRTLQNKTLHTNMRQKKRSSMKSMENGDAGLNIKTWIQASHLLQQKISAKPLVK